MNVRASRLDLEQNCVQLEDGGAVPFDRLLLATGSSPVSPPIEGCDLPGVQTLWSLDDVAQALASVDKIACPRVLFVGAGFVGMIVVGAMFSRGWKITVVEQADRILPRMLDDNAATIASRWLAEKNVEVRTGTTVQSIQAGNGNEKEVIFSDGNSTTVDLVILATGVRPNLQLVADGPIETDQGILVDEQMRTSVEGVYAAGDVAQGPALYESERTIHAIQPTAVDHGRVAGANMAGQSVHYPGSLSMNVVDVCGLQCVSYGNWTANADDDVVINNQTDFCYRRLVFNGDHLTGALFAGRPNEVGMLNDVGMVKGILQTQPALGNWKDYLKQNPFDIKRAYIGLSVPQKLAQTTLIGRPSQPRQFRFQDAEPASTNAPEHRVLIDAAKES